MPCVQTPKSILPNQGRKLLINNIGIHKQEVVQNLNNLLLLLPSVTSDSSPKIQWGDRLASAFVLRTTYPPPVQALRGTVSKIGVKPN